MRRFVTLTNLDKGASWKRDYQLLVNYAGCLAEDTYDCRSYVRCRNGNGNGNQSQHDGVLDNSHTRLRLLPALARGNQIFHIDGSLLIEMESARSGVRDSFVVRKYYKP